MSDTPRTDAHIEGLRRDPEVSGCDRTLNLCRQLERELTAAQAESIKLQEENTKLQERIARLEVAGDRMAAAWDKEWLTQAEAEAIIDDWYEAKDTP